MGVFGALDAAPINDCVLRIQYQNTRLPLLGRRLFGGGNASDGQSIYNALEIGGRAVECYGVRSARSRKDVGFNAFAICQVAAEDPFVWINAELLQESGIDSHASFIVEVAA